MLPGRPGQQGWIAKDNRLFINAVLWIAKTGAPWKDLPERFGLWNSLWKRFDRWSRKGVWQQIFEALASQDPDLEWVIFDGKFPVDRPEDRGDPGKKHEDEMMPSRYIY